MMKTRIGMNTIWIAVLLFAVMSPAHGQNAPYQTQIWIEHYLRSTDQIHAVGCSGAIQPAAKWTSDFYTQRKYLPTWIDESGLKPEAFLLISSIRKAEKESLFPKVYSVKPISQLITIAIFLTDRGGALPSDMAARLDIELTNLFFLYRISSKGSLNRPYVQNIHTLKEDATHLSYELEHALNTGTFDIFLNSLEPPPNYQRLKVAQKRYENIVTSGGWERIPKGPELKEGDWHDNVILLRKRLMLTEDLTKLSTENAGYFDGTLEKAVQLFQRRHGLNSDGIVGPSTLLALNVPAEKRLEQILVNLERLRQMPRSLGERYIEVNIPAFTLKIMDNGEIVQTMRVVVGRKDRPTPVFSGRITYLEINPYWTVPPQIAKKDILPKIQQDPYYLIRKQIKVFENWKRTAAELDPFSIDWNQVGERYFPYKLRQEPTANNALGQVKFIFPNKLNVYLHDTPLKELFQRQRRSFSSGCVRVEKPIDLAAYLLNDNHTWNRQKLSRMMKEKKQTPKVILLKHPISVYLLYQTVWMEDEDEVHFRNDIYHRDQALAQSLKKQPLEFRSCQNGQNSKQWVKSDPQDLVKEVRQQPPA
jgi:murein L,D-transpeptidase YcbB/YkuD